MEKSKSVSRRRLEWVPWIRWENQEIQCAPVGLETMDAVEKYAQKQSAENGMKYTII